MLCPEIILTCRWLQGFERRKWDSLNTSLPHISLRNILSLSLSRSSLQVEKNRLILKTVGKRTGYLDYDVSLNKAAVDDQMQFRMPFLRPSAPVWSSKVAPAQVHRSGYPKFDIYHEMDLRNFGSAFPSRGLPEDSEQENELANEDESGSNQSAVGRGGGDLEGGDLDEEDSKTIGLNI